MTKLHPDNAEQDTAAGAGGAAKVADLSDRQYACLVRAGQGMSSKEIGRSLGISPSTVDNHIHVAVAKLHARNRWHAAQLLHPNPSKAEFAEEPKQTLVPPIGGRLNTVPIRRRLLQMLTIAALALILLTSTYVSILGAIAIFGRG